MSTAQDAQRPSIWDLSKVTTEDSAQIVISRLVLGNETCSFVFLSEPYSASFRFGRCGKLADSVKDDSELGAVLLLKSFELSGEFCMGSKHSPQADKSAHDLNIHLDGAWTSQNARKHGNTLFGKGIGRIASSTPVT